MLELAKLYDSMGDTKKAKEIIRSTHYEMMKPVDEIKLSESDSSEVEAFSSTGASANIPNTSDLASASASTTVHDTTDLDTEAGSQE